MKTSNLEINAVAQAVSQLGRPLVVAYGMGVDSTAMLVGMVARNIRPDAILFADTGSEKDETMNYLPIMNAFLAKHGFPQVTVVRNEVQNFKHYPPYRTLEENCLTNGTVPSEVFGYGSCSVKWKAKPQNEWLEGFAPAIAAWNRGEKVIRAIGFDASCADNKRSYKAAKIVDLKCEYWYPLQDWNWDRAECKAQIAAAGLPVPPKSSCFFCPNMTKQEVRDLDGKYLRRIVFMEARAHSRLEGNMNQEQLDASYAMRLAKWERTGKAKGKKMPKQPKLGKGVKGLWRAGNAGKRSPEKKCPATMTEFIRAEGLLPTIEILQITQEAPQDLMNRAQAHAAGLEIESWDELYDGLGKSKSATCLAV